jgi:hypothetical protein
LADPLGFHAINTFDHLPMELHQLGACLTELLIGLGPLLEGFEFTGSRRDVLWPRSSAIGEDLGVMELSVGASAVGFSAASLECVDGAWQQGVTVQEYFSES